MATNLVSSIMSFLTPDIVSKIASSFGVERGTAQKVITASVPALLAGLVGLASKPEGARQLSGMLSQQPSGVLDNLRGLAGGSEQRTFVENGSSLLSSLFGGGMFSSLAGAVGKFAGIGEGTSKSMLGLLGPLVMGGVAQHQRQAGLDANGLSSYLASQKENITAAMPSGFSSMLSGTGLLDSLGDTWRSGSASAAEAARAGTATASPAAQRFAATAAESPTDTRRYASNPDHTMQKETSSNWLPWALGLVALAGLAWWLTSQPGPRVAEQAGTNAVQNLTVSGVNVGNQVTAAINGMKSALQGISDTTSAQAAVPRLRQAAATLDSASGLANQLPASARNALASRVATEIPTLDRDFDTVLARPEVAAVLGPEIDSLRTKLNALSRS